MYRNDNDTRQKENTRKTARIVTDIIAVMLIVLLAFWADSVETKADERNNTYTLVIDSNKKSEAIYTLYPQIDEEVDLSTVYQTSNYGYILDSWNTRADGKGTKYELNSILKNPVQENETFTLYAQWKADPSIKHYIRFNPGVGRVSGSMPDITDCVPGNTYTLTKNAFVNPGFRFIGWNTKWDGTGDAYDDEDSVTIGGEDLILYAQWEEDGSLLFTISFDPNGQKVTGTMSDIEKCKPGQAVTLPVNKYERVGYRFNGWNTKADGSGTYYPDGWRFYISAAEATGAPVTLYAQWVPSMTYRVEFNINSSRVAGRMDPLKNLLPDTEYTLPANTFVRPGYRFTGWNTVADGSGTAYADRAKIKDLTTQNNGLVTLYAQWESTLQNPDNIRVTYRTQEEIRSFVNAHPVSYLLPEYDTVPSTTQPFAPGRLKQSIQHDALNMVNNARFVAGVSANVTLSDEYITYAQAGSLINNLNNSMEHKPVKPAGVDESLYQTGYTGTSKGNLAYGYKTIAGAILKGYLSDSDDRNIDRVGHRRWVLNPSMGKTGFGYVGNQQCMYAFDSSGSSMEEVTIWPAQNMPLEYFVAEDAWSYSSGVEENKNAIKVLVEKEGGKSWSFSSSKADGYYNVENSYMGLRGCVIFRPDGISLSDGDTYTVTITGLKEGDVKYRVNFFIIDPSTYQNGLQNEDGSLGEVPEKDEQEDTNDNQETISDDNNTNDSTGYAFDDISNTRWQDVVLNGRSPYHDVSQSDWFYRPVMFMYLKRYMQGTGDGAFSPEQQMTRAMTVTTLHRVAGAPVTTAINPFHDVSVPSWYANAVIWGNQSRLVLGIGEGLFGTDVPISREMFATILMRYAMMVGRESNGSALMIDGYVDSAQVSEWARISMSWAVDRGIIEGMGGGRLDPQGVCTRAQVATMMERFMTKILGQ